MSSKRKSASQATMKDVDMVFEDDEEEMEDQQAESVASTSDSMKRSRVSGRAKKIKAIYDPSENNGPVHKRKKDALEAERLGKSEAKMSTKPKMPVEAKITPVEKTETVLKSPVKQRPSIPVKTKAVDQSKPEVKRRSIISKKPSPAPISKPAVPAVAKEPSKRIQEKRQNKSTESASAGELAFVNFLSGRVNSGNSDDYDKASTVDLNMGIPDVRLWSYNQVYEHFLKLNFSKQDASVFIEEEIDGEALLIMKRTDIITTKFAKLKLGTSLKIWSNILMIQTGSADPTQSWK